MFRPYQKFLTKPLQPLHLTPPKPSTHFHRRIPPSHHHRTLHLTSTAPNMSDLKVIHTDKAGPVAGPYSQAIHTPHAIYISGQLPSTASGALPAGSMAENATRCLANMCAILEAAGSGLHKVVKVTVFLVDMGDFDEVNGAYERAFGGWRPARSCVAVKELPRGVRVEMECVAVP